MASILRRRNSFVVVYTYTNEKGEQKQKWESFKTFEEAHKRRAEVEYTQDLGTFQAPSKKTISEFMDDFIRLYGENRWGLSMYSSNTALIRNYVNPIIGSIPIQAFTTMDADKFIKQLQGSKPVDAPVNHGVTKMLISWMKIARSMHSGLRRHFMPSQTSERSKHPLRKQRKQRSI